LLLSLKLFVLNPSQAFQKVSDLVPFRVRFTFSHLKFAIPLESLFIVLNQYRYLFMSVLLSFGYLNCLRPVRQMLDRILQKVSLSGFRSTTYVYVTQNNFRKSLLIILYLFSIYYKTRQFCNNFFTSHNKVSSLECVFGISVAVRYCNLFLVFSQ
jgi:hypothetical protein